MTKLLTSAPEQHDHFAVDDASTIDWHRHVFPLGVRTELTEMDPPFLALHPEALLVLEKLLTSKINGSESSAADEYLPLLTLATWCKRAREWADKRSVK